MSQFVAFIKTLVPHIPSQQERDQNYLSQAVDIYDVERRLSEIAYRSAYPYYQSPALGGALHG